MKRRTINYFKKAKAIKIYRHPMEADLLSFLSATLQLSKSRVVKTHIESTLHELIGSEYKLSA